MLDTGLQVNAISPPRLIIEPTPVKVPHLRLVTAPPQLTAPARPHLQLPAVRLPQVQLPALQLPVLSPRVTAAAAMTLMLVALLGAMFGLGYLAGQVI